MGTRYSINLFFPIENVQQALEAILPHTEHFDTATTVKLPNGKKITLSFADSFNQEDKKFIDFSSNEYRSIALLMLFPYDEYLGEYEKKLLQNISNSGNPQKEIIQDKSERCKVGYIYLYIQYGEKYAQFSFDAAVSRMNILFLKSSSVHNVFRSILRDGGGLYGHIDIEGSYEHVPLEHPKLYISPYDENPFAEEIYNSVDKMVLFSLKTLEYQREQWAKQGDAEAFYQKWVEPFRDIIIWREKLITEKAALAFATTKDYLKEFDDSILDLLLSDTHPRYLEAATWLIGLSKDERYLPQLQDLFIKNDWYREFSIQAYCFALVRLGKAIPSIEEDWWDKAEIELVVKELCNLL